MLQLFDALLHPECPNSSALRPFATLPLLASGRPASSAPLRLHAVCLIICRGADTSAFGLFLAQIYGPCGVLLLLADAFVWRLHVLLNTVVQSCSILAALGQAGCIISAHGTVMEGQAALDRVPLLLWGTALR